MMNDTCRTCFYCVPSKNDVTGGECHFNPPKVFLLPAQAKFGQPVVQKVAAFPPVKLDGEGCSKHTEMSG